MDPGFRRESDWGIEPFLSDLNSFTSSERRVVSIDPRARASALLRQLADTAPERVSLGDVTAALKERSIGIAVLCLALPNALPGPTMPGISALMALPIAWLGLQMARGRDHPHLPRWLGERSIGRSRFAGLVARTAPLLDRLERWLGPRPGWLTRWPGRRLPGFVLILYGLVLAMPIPLGNLPIAVAITVVALGLIERDSRALISGITFGALACLWNALLVAIGVAAASRLLGYVP
jgi:hypothetical protein